MRKLSCCFGSISSNDLGSRWDHFTKTTHGPTSKHQSLIPQTMPHLVLISTFGYLPICSVKIGMFGVGDRTMSSVGMLIHRRRAHLWDRLKSLRYVLRKPEMCRVDVTETDLPGRAAETDLYIKTVGYIYWAGQTLCSFSFAQNAKSTNKSHPSIHPSIYPSFQRLLLCGTGLQYFSS